MRERDLDATYHVEERKVLLLLHDLRQLLPLRMSRVYSCRLMEDGHQTLD